MRKLENLYVGLCEKNFVGAIDVEWAMATKERYLHVKSDGQIVCFIDLDVLLQSRKERKDEGKEAEEGIGEAKRVSCCF